MIRVLKIIVSVTLIGFLIWKADWTRLRGDFVSPEAWLVLVGIVLLTLQYPVSAWKWQKSLRLHGIFVPYWELLRVLCIAFFFNNFLPTAIGGDAYRAYRTVPYAERPAHPISAVILERLAGIASLLFLGYLCAIVLAVRGTLRHTDWVVTGLIITTAGILLLMLFFWFNLHGKVAGRLKKIEKLEPVVDSFRVLDRNREHFAGLIWLSLLFQALAIVTITFLFAAIAVPGRLLESGFTAAAAGIAGILPISINGIGVVESSFVAAAWESGLPYSAAIAVALFLRAYMLASSVVFGALYALEPKGKDPIIMERSKS